VDWSAAPQDIDTIARDLRALRTADGGTSYAEIARRIEKSRAARGIPEHERRLARSTVYDCFKEGRKRLDIDLSVEIGAALGLGPDLVPQWSTRCLAAQGIADAASVVTLRTEIPPPVPEFVGREESISTIVRAIESGAGTVWIDGMPGMGKTQLSVRAASILRERGWRAGIFVDLGGHRGTAPAVSPDAVADAVLRHLGAGEHASKPARRRGAALRAHLAATRTILILDDARDEAQVAEILGDAAGGAVLVTSRTKSVAIADTAIALEELDADEAVALLNRLSGSPESTRDHSSAVRLADAAGRLPLALVLTARRLSSHPGWTLSDHAEFLERRLAENRVDDRVRDALALSVADIDDRADRLLRLIADAPVGVIDAQIAAVVSGTDPGDAVTALTALENHNLLIPLGGDRFALHALVRAFSADRAAEIDTPRERTAAFTRLGEHVVDTVWAAYATLAQSIGDTPRPARFTYSERAWSSEEADAWLTEHLDDILSIAYAASSRGRPQILIQISEGISWWLNLQGRHQSAIVLHEAAVQAAATLGDATAYATASLDVGQLFAGLGRAEEALTHLRRAARLEGDLDDPGIRGLLRNMIGVALIYSGEIEQSLGSFREAAAVHRELGQFNRLLSCLVNEGVALSRLGRSAEGLAVNDEALAVAESSGHRLMLANLTGNRAQLLLDLGRPDDSLATARRGLELSKAVNFRIGWINGECIIGHLLHRRGEMVDARAHLTRALDMARETDDPRLCAEVGVRFCRFLADEAGGDELRTMLTEVSRWCAQTEDPVLQGQFALLQGDLASDPDERMSHWTRAAELVSGVSVPLVAEAEQRMASSLATRA